MIECLDSVFPRVALPQRGKGALERGVKQRRERIAADQRKRVMKPEVVIRCLNGILRIPDSLYRAIEFFVILCIHAMLRKQNDHIVQRAVKLIKGFDLLRTQTASIVVHQRE